ncbi:MAG: hypothetical protein JJ891_13345 [Rhizobiaceae bacterium]|nr:hypothetical protein [Rhizobiaceae bacterium]
MARNPELIDRHLANWQTGWSMGAFGALAEFHQDDGEATLSTDQNTACRATGRGAIRFDLDGIEALVPIAYETLSPRAYRWNQAVALCLPVDQAKLNQRSVLTELGPDENPILKTSRQEILFDMGLSLFNCDFCIRTSNKELLQVLRENLGRSLFEQDNPAMAAILKHHPHRVSVTRAGRVEVFQKIGGPDTGGKSPIGPHTHVLPKLLKSGRTHTANTPIPEGLIPIAYLHPGNPVSGPLGEDREFVHDLYEKYQSLMKRYGLPQSVRIKKELKEALQENAEPTTFAEPDDRYTRAALRVGLRQHNHLAALNDDPGLVALISRWRDVFDSRRHKDAEDDEAPGH